MVVFHHEVLIEEPDRLLRRSGGEADEEGIEVFQHLPPEAVDGAVALVGDDEVEGFDGDGRVVGDGQSGSGILPLVFGVKRRDAASTLISSGDFVAGSFVEFTA